MISSFVRALISAFKARRELAVPSIYSSARTELAKLLIYGLFQKGRVLAQDGGVGRAFAWWLCHWVISALVLFANTGPAAVSAEWCRLARAALGISFANAHTFLFLATKEGYLAPSRELLENNDEWGMLIALGTVEAVLGPIFLFLLLLTLRNRFRLA